MRIGLRTFVVLFITITIACQTSVGQVRPLADENHGHAPDNTKKVKYALGGAYYAEEVLVDSADKLRKEIRELETEMKSSLKAAIKKADLLDETRLKLAETMEKIEDSMVLVEAIKVYRRKQAKFFELGPSKRVILNCGSIRIRKWEGPTIKCVFEKIILAKSQPSDEDFDKIKLVHRYGSVEDIVGIPEATQRATEKEFRESEAAKDLPQSNLDMRSEFLEARIISQAKYKPFQDQQCDVLSIEGLEAGPVSLLVRSKRSATNFSQPRHQAILTVHLPECDWVAARGGGKHVYVDGLDSNLLLTEDGPSGRNYEGEFEVKNVKGNVVVDQVPIRVFENIQGNIEVMETASIVNSGESFTGEERFSYVGPNPQVSYRNIAGDIRANYLKTDLRFKGVTGKLDIKNEFGDSYLHIDKGFPADVTHRVVSEYGFIEVRGSKPVLTAMTLYLGTNVGNLSTNLSQEELKTQGISYRDANGAKQSWTSYHRGLDEDSSSERGKMAIQNQERSAGLDLVSRGGNLRVLTDNAVQDNE